MSCLKLNCYRHIGGELQDKIDDFGFINKITMCDLIGEDAEEDDSWIMYLEGWDYEVHHGIDKFRPTNIRGKVLRELNEQWILDNPEEIGQ